MIPLKDFIQSFEIVFPNYEAKLPWQITASLSSILHNLINHLGSDYRIEEGIAIHKTAIIEQNVILKAPVIVSENCFIGANAYLRGGVYLGTGTKIGTSCEVKTTVVMNNSGIAHFNFIGDSLIGSHVNFEAGSITANHYNERRDKIIKVWYKAQEINTNCEKFGALVGDGSKIGANAVLSPGTILLPDSTIGRLELVNQEKLLSQ